MELATPCARSSTRGKLRTCNWRSANRPQASRWGLSWQRPRRWRWRQPLQYPSASSTPKDNVCGTINSSFTEDNGSLASQGIYALDRRSGYGEGYFNGEKSRSVSRKFIILIVNGLATLRYLWYNLLTLIITQTRLLVLDVCCGRL